MQRLTPSGVVLSAYAEIIGRWSKRKDFCIDITILNRPSSESSTEDDIYCMIDQIIKIDKIIEAHDISEELSYITDIQYDIIIINYDKVRIRHGDFKMIFDIRCKTQAPLLVILEGCEIRDKLHVLNMKADDYIEKPINIDELEEKMLQLLHKLS